MPLADKQITEVDVRRAAMDLLARREHTRRELCDKLQRRFGDSPFINSQIEKLAHEGLQSDERFVESFVQYRRDSGKGPLHIAQELKQRGVDGMLIEAYLDPHDDEWRVKAQAVLAKKFGQAKAQTPAERAKRVRFLQYRGFSGDLVFKLV